MNTFLIEWYLDWVPNVRTRTLRFLLRRLGTKAVVRRAFTDHAGNGCVAEWAGRHHPACRGAKYPGIAFLELIGRPESSAVVELWDNDRDRTFTEQLRAAIRAELTLRTLQHEPLDVFA